jgi:hypothetical protein
MTRVERAYASNERATTDVIPAQAGISGGESRRSSRTPAAAIG